MKVGSIEDDSTKRFSRSLIEAFGPHTSRQICEPHSEHRADWITVIGCLVVVAALIIWRLL